MYKVNIPNNRAHAAIVWAKENIGGSFEVQHMMPARCYEFRFDRSEQASYFALKWT
jgi:hypothetical protein